MRSATYFNRVGWSSKQVWIAHFMMPEIWIWNNKFRVAGVLLAVAFHAVMFAVAFNSENAELGGYRWLFTWYMPSMVLGFPWSIAALFLGLLVPGGTVLGLAISVCFNAYLVCWPIDAVVNQTRRIRQQRNFETYLHSTTSSAPGWSDCAHNQ